MFVVFCVGFEEPDRIHEVYSTMMCNSNLLSVFIIISILTILYVDPAGLARSVHSTCL